jgi:hypothetical protein
MRTIDKLMYDGIRVLKIASGERRSPADERKSRMAQKVGVSGR